MKTTGNLGLKKPDGTDIVDITDLNGNMDILDTAVKAVQDHAADTVKHITAAERTAWNAKASTSVATTTAAGLMAAADKSKLDSVAQGANNYVHPSTHSPSIIVQDSSNRFVSDAEKTAWNGKANLVTTPQQTTADVTYFVRTDGNDNNTGLANTAGGAFRTIQKAVNMIPKIVNHPVNINLAAGTYSENVLFEGFSGGSGIAVNGAATAVATHMINNFRVHQCSIQVVAYGLTATTTTAAGFIAQRANGMLLVRCVVNAASNNPGVFADSSFVQMGDSCSISNRDVAIYAHVNAMIFSQGTTGSGNTIAFTANYGSRISYSGFVPGAITLSSVNEGGMVVPTSGVVNPWGDNTTNLRPASRAAGSGIGQSLSAGIWSKVQFVGENYDMAGNYDNVLHRFKVSVYGLYQINAIVTVLSAPSASVSELALYLNGIQYRRLDFVFHPAVNSASLIGAATILAGPGDYIEIYVRNTSSVTLSTGSDISFEVTKIA